MMMRRNGKQLIAWCLVASWTLLLGVRVVDAFEDADEGPEAIDLQVAQALTTPLVPAAQPSCELAHAPLPQAVDHAIPSALDLPAMHASAGSLIATPPGPPPRDRLFQTFSIYRL